MTEFIEQGQNGTFYSAEDGATGTFGLGGIGNTAEDYELSNNRAMAAAKASFAGDIGAWAETWTKVYVEHPASGIGDYTSPATITIDGFWSAYLDSLAAGSEVRLTAFVRDSSGNLDSTEVLHKVSSTFDLFTGNDTFSVELNPDLETNSLYEVGIRTRTNAQALSYSAGLADVYTSDDVVQYTGRHEYDSIKLVWD